MTNVVFMGSDAIALPALNWMAGEGSSLVRVVAVFTQPDRATGRGQKVQPNAIKQWALAQNLPVHQPAKFSTADRDVLAALAPDLVVVMAYGHILRQDVIDTPRLGTVNLHASILPRFRGASPIQSAIASGERETGVSLMRMVLALDAGPVADVERFAIGPLDTAADIEARMADACVPLLRRTLPALAAGTLRFAEQEHARATFCRRLEKSDGTLDFSRPTAELAARINGLMPWPGCAVEFAGGPLKIGRADVAADGDESRVAPGTVMGSDADGVLVATGAGILRLRQLQRPGGRMLPAVDFTRGCPLSAGTVLPSKPMPALVADKPFSRPKI